MSEFFTYEGYFRTNRDKLTKSMEDYLEMIFRLTVNDPVVRIKQLAESLNVRDSSVTRMVKQLGELGYVKYKPYEYIRLTPEGVNKGKYLLHRHEVLHRFLKLINGSEDELEQVELIEHHINEKTVCNIERFLDFLEANNIKP